MKSKEFKRIFHLIIFEKIIFNNQNLLNQHATNIIFKFMQIYEIDHFIAQQNLTDKRNDTFNAYFNCVKRHATKSPSVKKIWMNRSLFFGAFPLNDQYNKIKKRLKNVYFRPRTSNVTSYEISGTVTSCN